MKAKHITQIAREFIKDEKVQHSLDTFCKKYHEDLISLSYIFKEYLEKRGAILNEKIDAVVLFKEIISQISIMKMDYGAGLTALFVDTIDKTLAKEVKVA